MTVQVSVVPRQICLTQGPLLRQSRRVLVPVVTRHSYDYALHCAHGTDTGVCVARDVRADVSFEQIRTLRYTRIARTLQSFVNDI